MVVAVSDRLKPVCQPAEQDARPSSEARPLSPTGRWSLREPGRRPRVFALAPRGHAEWLAGRRFPQLVGKIRALVVRGGPTRSLV